MKADEKIWFASDYMEGAHPEVMRRLEDTNLLHTPGYGMDAFSESAREKIRQACACPEAEIWFLSGGTQVNATVLTALLQPYQGVIAAGSGHINVHEAGAVEYGGHKVLALPHENGILRPETVEAFVKDFWADENREHMVMPGAVYISQPTEYGTLYSLRDLEALSRLCREYGMALYVDGARLAYALACPENDVQLSDLARLCDAFYIGGTKCGTLFGEALVFPKKGRIPHFYTMTKQHGAMLAKGRIAGVMFETLFSNDLYRRIGETAMLAAQRIRAALDDLGIEQVFGSTTNQIFIALDEKKLRDFGARVEMSFWEKRADGKTVMRLATSWATTGADVDALITVLSGNAG